MPIPVSDGWLVGWLATGLVLNSTGPYNYKLTSANYFLLNVPLAQHGKQESHCVDNGHRQAQLYSSMVRDIGQQGRDGMQIAYPEEAYNVPACPMSRKNHTLPVRLIINGTA